MAYRTETKICVVDGKEFQGTERAMVCGAACRKHLQRLLKAQKKPKYFDEAKRRGQRVPDLLKAKKALSFEEKMIIKTRLESEIKDIKGQHPQGHPKLWALKVEEMVKAKQDEIDQLFKK